MLFIRFIGFPMRRTIDIEDDVIANVRELARKQNVIIGQVISRLMREALSGFRHLLSPARLKLKRSLGFVLLLRVE
jgi:hypothetical protein